jgi:16S rRNA (uracil1498-N3)-methyltransferase
MKQSLHSRKPNVDELISFEDFLSKAELNPSKYMAHCAEGERMEMLPNQLQLPATLLIGPEGDFHPEEVELAASQGFKMISMGHYRLRTETAAVYGCSLLLNSVFNSL